jgi:hypothetical protein
VGDFSLRTYTNVDTTLRDMKQKETSTNFLIILVPFVTFPTKTVSKHKMAVYDESIHASKSWQKIQKNLAGIFVC